MFLALDRLLIRSIPVVNDECYIRVYSTHCDEYVYHNIAIVHFAKDASIEKLTKGAVQNYGQFLCYIIDIIG